jgi:UDP-glucose 4-epimerase
MSRCLVWQRPIQIYVPLDTIRDYLHADDCARQIAHCLAAWLRRAPPSPAEPRGTIKLLAAQQATSVARLVQIFSRLATRRHPRVICAPRALGVQQPRRLEFRSRALPDLSALRPLPLHIGISQVHRHHLELYRQGRLPAP